MKLRRLAFLFLPALALFALLLDRPLLSQSPRIYPPFEPTAEFKEALDLAGRGYTDAAREALTQIARKNPGTTLAAQALLKRGEFEYDFGDPARARATCQELLAGYPFSRFELSARNFLIDLEGDHYSPRWIEVRSTLAQSYGGPSVSEIVKNRRGAVRTVTRLHPEIKAGLEDIYGSIQGAFFGQDRLSDGLEMALFCQASFPNSPVSYQYSHEVFYFLVLQRFGDWGAAEEVPAVDPELRILSPKPNQKKGPRPKIRFETSCGDWKSPQIDIGTLKFTLGGQDLRPLMQVRTQHDKRLRDGRVYEELRISARPIEPLSSGEHTVEVKASVVGYSGQGPGTRAISWKFTVASPRDDDEDERDDDTEGWGD